MGPVSRIIKFLERNLTWLQLLTGGGLLTAIGWLSKRAAEQTDWVTALGPYGVLLASIAGALLAAGLILALVWGRYVWLRGSAMNQWRESVGDRINPLAETFRSQRVRLADLVSPAHQVIRNKKFYDCELIGPGNVVLRVTDEGKGAFVNVTLGDCDWVVCRPGAPSKSFIILEDCQFMGGSVHNIMFFLNNDEASALNMPGMNWITAPPSRPAEAQ